MLAYLPLPLMYSVDAQSLSIQKKTKLAPSAYQNFGNIVGDYLYLGADNVNLFKVEKPKKPS